MGASMSHINLRHDYDIDWQYSQISSNFMSNSTSCHFDSACRIISLSFDRLLCDEQPLIRKNLAVMIAAILGARSADLNAMSEALPHEKGALSSRRRWISRFLANANLECDRIMAPFAREALVEAAAMGDPVVLILDQLQLCNGYKIAMLALRCGDRALPLVWRIGKIGNGLDFLTEKVLVETVAGWLHAWTHVVLMADRIDETAALVKWCKDHQWDYHLGLDVAPKLLVNVDKMPARKFFLKNQVHYKGVVLSNKEITTNINILYDHKSNSHIAIAISDRPIYCEAAYYKQGFWIQKIFFNENLDFTESTDSKFWTLRRLYSISLATMLSSYFNRDDLWPKLSRSHDNIGVQNEPLQPTIGDNAPQGSRFQPILPIALVSDVSSSRSRYAQRLRASLEQGKQPLRQSVKLRVRPAQLISVDKGRETAP